MLAARLARSAVPKNALARAQLHSSAVARSAHGDYHHFPFKTDNKAGLAFKVASFMAFGFSIPFLMSMYQLKKAGGAA